MATEIVKVINAALAETNGRQILRGVIEPRSLPVLQSDDYQREVLKINDLIKAFKNGGNVPDIILGMRGSNYSPAENGAIYLHNPVYIIDGLQRVSAARDVLEQGEVSPYLGAMIHFNTNFDWESEQFDLLNQKRTRISPNVHLRNLRKKYSVMEMLYNLCEEESFALNNKVCWKSLFRDYELIAASTYIKVLGQLHSHLGRGFNGNVTRVTTELQRVADEVGINVVKSNVLKFFDTVDSAFGIRNVYYRETATSLRGTFLMTLGSLFSKHLDFWTEENQFTIDASLLSKLSKFQITDPGVSHLVSLGGKPNKVLLAMLQEHINSGKRRNFLTPRFPVEEKTEE